MISPTRAAAGMEGRICREFSHDELMSFARSTGVDPRGDKRALCGRLIRGAQVRLARQQNKDTCRQDDRVPRNALKRRQWGGLPTTTQGLIDLVTLQDDVFPVGSFLYKAHRYPGDIDVFEPITVVTDDPNMAAKTVTKKLQALAADIQSHPNTYLGDFKAGLDDRYMIDPAKDRKTQLQALHDAKLLTPQQYRKALWQPDDGALDDYMRQFYLVRWNLDELRRGRKQLPKNKTLRLEDALQHKSIVKLDVWAPLDGDYNEVTNFLIIVQEDPTDGTKRVLNQELGDRIESLNHDIVKYASANHRNSLKLAKRLWNKALVLGNEGLAKQLVPLFQSDVNILNQVAGESEVLRLMLDKLKDPPLNQMRQQIDRFNRRITDVYSVDFDPQPMFDVIDDIVDQSIPMQQGLFKLESLLQGVVEEAAADYLRCHVPQTVDLIRQAQLEQAPGRRVSEDLSELDD